jgi:hypothetical protein
VNLERRVLKVKLDHLASLELKVHREKKVHREIKALMASQVETETKETQDRKALLALRVQKEKLVTRVSQVLMEEEVHPAIKVLTEMWEIREKKVKKVWRDQWGKKVFQEKMLEMVCLVIQE